MAFRNMLLVRRNYAFIHLLEGNAKAIGEGAKALFNIHNPTLKVINLVNVDIPIP